MVAQNWMLACKRCGFTGDPDQYCNIVKKSSIFVILRGGGGVRTLCPPSGSAHVLGHKQIIILKYFTCDPLRYPMGSSY